MAEKTVNVKGMTCGHCEGRVSAEILAIPGVTGVTVSAEKARAVITSDSEISGDAIESAVQAAGYSLVP
ncbi:MAG: cation transporter [Candidatus Planktophila sp.]|nr:cation transporter [Candidatus Planktophila sp.]